MMRHVPALSERELTWLKAVIALVGFALLWWEHARPDRVSLRAKKRVAALLGVAALVAYFQLFRVEYQGYFHRWDVFHYYMGSKYAPELGYERLYFCTALADADTGNRKRVERRRIRDLRDDRMRWGREVLDDPLGCRARFSPERWRAFTSDVVWFRRVSGAGDWWDRMQTDHGYNASPVWTAAGHAISSRLAPSVNGFRALACLDLVLMAGTLVALFWGFGWRITALAALYWGTQAPADMYWTGGAFLRLDWLFWTVLATALLRKRRPFWAGACLAYAALLRLFPVLLFGGPLVLMSRELWKRRKLSQESRHFVAGAALALALLVPWGASVAGPRSYSDFYAHISMHASTPISNHMSLRTLLSVAPGKSLAQTGDAHALDPIEAWTEARRARLAALAPVRVVASVVLVLFFVYTLWRLRTRWIAVTLSLLLIVTLTDPTCYYFLIWILVAVLSRARRSLEIALVGLAAIGQVLVLRVVEFDLRFVALSALYLAFSVVMVAMFARPLDSAFRRVIR
jgi:hypothetical protein